MRSFPSFQASCMTSSRELPMADLAANVQRGRGWTALAILGGVICLSTIPAAITIGRPTSIPGMILVAAAIWICNLSAFLAAFGQSYLRFLTVLVPPPLVALLAWVSRAPDYWAMSIFFYGLFVIVAGVGGILRVTSGRLLYRPHVESSEALQFGLRHLFITTTAIAMLATIGRLIETANWILVSISALVIVATVALSIGSVTVVAVWALFGRRLTLVRWGVLLGSLLLASVVLVIGLDPHLRVFWFSTALLENFLFIAALLCLRIEGYRFVKTK